MALASPCVNSLELTRKKKNSDMKACVDFTLLLHCDSHPPLTAHPAHNKRKVGQGGKTSFPHVIDSLPYLIQQRLSFCFHDLLCSIPLCVMQESLESIPDKVITALHTFGKLISYLEG